MQFSERVPLSSTPKPPCKRRKVSRKDRTTCIDVDKHVPICELNTWITNGTFTLLHEDKNILLHPAAWLTSSIITAAQNMLKEQHGSMGGLQDPCLSQSMGFRKVSGDFVQVVHNGFGHWLTVTNIGADSDAEIMVYDSLYPSIGTFVQKQIATLLHTDQKEIKVNIMNMQVQSGTCDCGLFALATATSLVDGVHPGAITFKQSEMRRHLYDCFRSGRLTSFLVLKNRRAVSKIKYTESFPVYCTCRMIELPSRDMVECSKCLEWFHVDCLQVPVPKDAFQDSKVDWFCNVCTYK